MRQEDRAKPLELARSVIRFTVFGLCVPYQCPEIREITTLSDPGPIRNWHTDDVSIFTDADLPKEELFGP
jgi:hypothetical protein